MTKCKQPPPPAREDEFLSTAARRNQLADEIAEAEFPLTVAQIAEVERRVQGLDDPTR
jgi:hypothetical protein